jgi:protein SCO1/2
VTGPEAEWNGLVSFRGIGEIEPAMSSRRIVVAMVVALGLAGTGLSCRQDRAAVPPPPTAVVPATNPHLYQVKGVVKELEPEKRKVKITHEEIPGYMEAMTMLFDVKDARELEGLQPGDTVSFRMIVTEADGWIDQVKKIDGPRTPLPTTDPAIFRRVREVDPLVVGDALPDYTFTNSAGQVVRLSDYKGQALAFTFIFTRCPFPTFCPRLNADFAEAQAKLKSLPDGPTNWHLLSITIDPAYDTPQRLAEYATLYHPDTAHWDFVTGDLTDITAIGEQFGLQFWREKPNEPINHNVRTVVVDAAGRVQWVTSDNEWKPDLLVEQILKAAAVKPQG